MATTKPSRSPKAKSKSVARTATRATTKRKPSAVTRRSAAPHRKAASPASTSDNPPLSPKIRATLAELKKRGESVLSQLTATITSKKATASKSKTTASARAK